MFITFYWNELTAYTLDSSPEAEEKIIWYMERTRWDCPCLGPELSAECGEFLLSLRGSAEWPGARGGEQSVPRQRNTPVVPSTRPSLPPPHSNKNILQGWSHVTSPITLVCYFCVVHSGRLLYSEILQSVTINMQTLRANFLANN